MKVGMIGLGKLGYPCAVAMQAMGHSVMGFDTNPEAMSNGPKPYMETGPDGVRPFNEWAKDFPIRFGTPQQVVDHSDIIFVAVQTPHQDSRYGGSEMLPATRADFDYSYLKSALMMLAPCISKPKIVVVVSTVLPGTFDRELRPIIELNQNIKLCYNPFFIAMGTAVRDFLNPKFVLFGVYDDLALHVAELFYQTITNAPFCRMSIPSAEAVKVFYNTFITQKIVFANAVMEVCHKVPGCDVDDVQSTLKLATRRLISPAYMEGGMGDGGGCHPRDNIALSWLARKLDMEGRDIFEGVMMARQWQTEWFADLMCEYDLPKAILGYAFKAGTNITAGSPALLLANLLRDRSVSVELYDPYIDAGPDEMLDWPHVYLIGTKHPEFPSQDFPAGSVVIDPWRYIPDKDRVTVIRLGVGMCRSDEHDWRPWDEHDGLSMHRGCRKCGFVEYAE